MATKIGTVRCISVSEGSAFTTIQDSGGGQETFILWFGSTIPASFDAFTRVLHSMWVSILRDAFTNGSTVTVITASGSAEVLTVRMGVL
ncbi:MAG TPA: hypothetical protein VFR81_26090 [Longimicrobium sp.]|nr:hypothetical protein [Longimicrobium sp.]